MATLFNPKCGSNTSILSIADMQSCARLSLYIGIAVMFTILVVVNITQGNTNWVYLSSVSILAFVMCILLTPLVNLIAKRTKQSQQIDEDGLVKAGVNPVNAKLASFTEQSIKNVGKSSTSQSAGNS